MLLRGRACGRWWLRRVQVWDFPADLRQGVKWCRILLARCCLGCVRIPCRSQDLFRWSIEKQTALHWGWKVRNRCVPPQKSPAISKQPPHSILRGSRLLNWHHRLKIPALLFSPLRVCAPKRCRQQWPAVALGGKSSLQYGVRCCQNGRNGLCPS